MTLHVYANIVTAYGTASNNHGETDRGSNTITLQKLIWQGRPHTTVSAEAIRFALRRRLFERQPDAMNRWWNEDERKNEWRNATFSDWLQGSETSESTYIDDDLLGFMAAEASKEEGEKGSAEVRRSVLEVTRAVSLTAWCGDVHSAFASPNATPSAQKKGEYSAPYTVELHPTRYQYGIAMTPRRLRKRSRAALALGCLGALGQVAGNQARSLFDFTPDAIVIRLTDDPAPRILYCFDTADDGKTMRASSLVERIKVSDVSPEELIVGLSDSNSPLADQMRTSNVKRIHGVREAVQIACNQMNGHADVKGD